MLLLFIDTKCTIYLGMDIMTCLFKNKTRAGPRGVVYGGALQSDDLNQATSP